MIISYKSIDGVLGTQTRGGRMVGADVDKGISCGRESAEEFYCNYDCDYSCD